MSEPKEQVKEAKEQAAPPITEDDCEEMLLCARYGEVDDMKAWIADGVPIDSKDGMGNTGVCTLIRKHAALLHSLTPSLNHSFTQSLLPSFTPSLTPSLTHSFTHSFTHSLTHSLTLDLCVWTCSPALRCSQRPAGLRKVLGGKGVSVHRQQQRKYAPALGHPEQGSGHYQAALQGIQERGCPGEE